MEEDEIMEIENGLDLTDLDDSQDWRWIDSDRDDFYNDDMLMGCDA